jgi:CYTH domain-containing protein
MVDVEIERKFLVKNFNPDDFNVIAIQHITQHYIMNTVPEMRVRHLTGKSSKNDRVGEARNYYFFTYKSDGKLCRTEHEFLITEEEFINIVDRFKPDLKTISKLRYRVDQDGYVIYIDQYEGSLTGLCIAEIEFVSKEDATEYKVPGWLGTEVTFDSRYKNKSLSTISDYSTLGGK